MKKWERYILALSAAVIMCACVSACGARKGKNDYPKLTGEEARNLFLASSDIKLTGDLDQINTSSDVIADGKNVGKVREKGFVNSSIIYSLDGEDKFYVTMYTKGDVKDKRYPSSTTYAYYDMDGNCLGYAQNRVLFPEEDAWHVMTFLEADGRMKDYYIEANDDWMHEWAENGATIYNMDREQVGEVKLELKSRITNKFLVEIQLGEAAEQLSEMDRVAVYWRCVLEENNSHTYLLR